MFAYVPTKAISCIARIEKKSHNFIVKCVYLAENIMSINNTFIKKT